MICPGCGHDNVMAYSVLSNGLICLERDCGYEIEIGPAEACQVLEPVNDAVCA